MTNKKNILSAFEGNPKALRNYLTIRKILLKNNEDDSFVEECLSSFDSRNIIKINSKNVSILIKCPKCNGVKVSIHKVNTTRCNQIPDKNLKTQCICSECGEEFFSPLTISELRKIYNAKK